MSSFSLNAGQKLGIAALAIALLFSISYVANRYSEPARPKPINVTLAQLEREFDSDPAGAEKTYANQPVYFAAVVHGENDGDLLLNTIYLLPVRAKVSGKSDYPQNSVVTMECDRVLLWQFMGSSKPEPDGCTVDSVNDAASVQPQPTLATTSAP